jgi:hypothetical protein
MSETTLSLTEHEILALLSFNDTESASYSREVLRLSDVGARDTLVRAGLSTLLVRDHAMLRDADLVLAGPASMIAGITATADEWLEIAVASGATTTVLFAVRSAGGAFVMSVGSHGVHRFDPLPQDRPVLSFALDIARHYLGTTDPDSKLAVRAKHHGLGTDPRSATLLRGTDGAVRVALGDGPEPALTRPGSGAEIDAFGEALDFDGQ